MTEVGATFRVALLWRGDPRAPAEGSDRGGMLQPLFDALAGLGATPEAVVYADDVAGEVRDRLLGFDGVLVWVNPIQDGQDRSTLDAVLREVASKGVWVSANPDVILKMGTKQVLYDTRELGWGTDTHLYRDHEELSAGLRQRLGGGPRVLKQYRGNGGNGVWKVELVTPGPPVGPDALVVVDHAMQSAGQPRAMTFGEFVERSRQYFEGEGRLVDQPYLDRLGEGMVRCYFVHDEVVGFTHQHPRGLLPRREVLEETPAVRPPMEGADAPAYQGLRRRAEGEWVPQMKALLGIGTTDLPVIWDADFLFGPKTASGEDSYVLCEINISAVWPYPPQATPEIARAAVAQLSAVKRG